MEKNNIFEFLKENPYPGRGIIIGKDAGGVVIAYWIMGRSENSRNRVFTETDDGRKTEAFDPYKMTDPSLIIYHPVREYGGKTIVTNGDQTDTVYEFMKDGKTPEEALMTREFEPDAPNFTPRISGAVDDKTGDFTLSILKSNNGDSDTTIRSFFHYTNLKAGEGRFVSTYMGDGDPLPSFEGEPVRVEIALGFDEFSDTLWNSLNADNKVSLYTQRIDLKTGEKLHKIYNKNR